MKTEEKKYKKWKSGSIENKRERGQQTKSWGVDFFLQRKGWISNKKKKYDSINKKG